MASDQPGMRSYSLDNALSFREEAVNSLADLQQLAGGTDLPLSRLRSTSRSTCHIIANQCGLPGGCDSRCPILSPGPIMYIGC